MSKIRHRPKRTPSGVCRYCPAPGVVRVWTVAGLWTICRACYRKHELRLLTLQEEAAEG